MDLFKRLPKFRPLPREEQQLIPPTERGQYPAFLEEFEILERELMPHFRTLDNEAIGHQNWYRGMYVILIFGSALVTILGIVQIAIDIDGIGIAGTIVAACLGITMLIVQAFRHHERYFNARLASELLRHEYFLFLGHLDPYAHEQERLQRLIERVTDIKMRGERAHAA